MKVLEIKFKKLDGTLINSVEFNELGLSVIYGKIVNRANLKESTNGVGKSIVMKSINYLFGSNSDESMYSKLSDYQIEAIILLNETKHFVIRQLKQDGQITFDGVTMTLEEYKNKINIDRNIANKQILLQSRNKIAETPGITYNSNDLIAIFKLLGFGEISAIVKSLDTEKKDLVSTKKSIDQLLELMDIKEDNIDNRIRTNEEQLAIAKAKERELIDKIKELSIDGENASIQKQFEIDNGEIKRLRKENYRYETELRQLENYLDVASSFSMTSDEIKAIYEESKIILPDLVYTTIEETEKFYIKVVEDRRKTIEKRIGQIRTNMRQNDSQIELLSKSLADKSSVLSKNDAYQNSIVLLSDIQNTIENLSVEQGRLEHYKVFKKKQTEIQEEMKRLYSELDALQKNCASKIETYKKFVYDTSKMLYDDDEASLQVQFKEYNLRSLPISLDISLRREHSDGVSQVKNLIFDYLLFKHNNLLEVLVHDSGCFNDVDTRQVSTLLSIGNDIATKTNKQYIVALNAYDVHDSAGKLVEEKIVLELSEDNLLLKTEF